MLCLVALKSLFGLMVPTNGVGYKMLNAVL